MIVTARGRCNEPPRQSASIFRDTPAADQTAACHCATTGTRARSPVSVMKLS
jgi:hypothetical protein